MTSTKIYHPRLSIVLITYNHSKYLKKSIESILYQRMDENYEIIVADDFSTDDTIENIKRYAKNYSHINFRFLDYTTKRGISRNYQRAFSACQGEYVAVMEGDDYWVSPYKLKNQIEFLDEHWECGLCSVNYFVYEENRCQFTPRKPVGTGYILIGARELIKDNIVGNFSTCMYRRKALDQLPAKVFDVLSYDWAINICICRKWLIGFLQNPMSVYRVHDEGAWSMMSHTKKLRTQLELIPTYDTLTEGVFQPEFSTLAETLEEQIKKVHIKDTLLPEAIPMIKSAAKIIDFMPPIFLTLIRMLLPPALKRYLVAIIIRGQE